MCIIPRFLQVGNGISQQSQDPNSIESTQSLCGVSSPGTAQHTCSCFWSQSCRIICGTYYDVSCEAWNFTFTLTHTYLPLRVCSFPLSDQYCLQKANVTDMDCQHHWNEWLESQWQCTHCLQQCFCSTFQNTKNEFDVPCNFPWLPNGQQIVGIPHWSNEPGCQVSDICWGSKSSRTSVASASHAWNRISRKVEKLPSLVFVLIFTSS